MIVLWDHIESRNGVWNVEFRNVEGSYELTGPIPVQGVGTIANVDFYFRAKDNEWEFETNDEKGWLFPDDDPRAFQRRGNFTKPYPMPHSRAAKIIAECVTELVEQLS